MAPRPKLWHLGQKIMAPRLKFSSENEGITFLLVFSIDGGKGAGGKKRVKSNKYSQKVTNIVKKGGYKWENNLNC